MPKMSIYVSSAMLERMVRYDAEVNWSNMAQAAFEAAMAHVDREHERELRRKSRITAQWAETEMLELG
jgi:hypothetical protein